ncbi:MAG: ATP-binding protein [Thermodesulfobacteriota bacterium]|nr:ATP-binding protein [Thermodesulfobacteriota bacterium]
MRTEAEQKYLLKAVDAFRKRMIVVSPDFKILAASFSPDTTAEPILIGKYCHDIYYDRESPCLNCAVKEVLQSGQSALRPQQDESPDLIETPCYFAYPIFSGDRIEAIVSMDFSFPNKSAVEGKIRRANALLHNLLLSAADGVIAADTNGRILIFNEAAEHVFGYTAKEALNNLSIHDIYPDQKQYDIMRKLRSKKFDGKGKLRSYQVEVINKAGKRIPISLNASIIYDQEEEIATIGFFHDLRDQLQMQKELERTQLQLLQAEKMASLGKLSAGVAHQLNNPLGGITLFTKLILEEYELETGIKEDLHRILKDAERCRDTVKELLEFSRQTRHFVQPHDINKAVSRTLFLLENQTLFHNIEIKKDLSSIPLVSVDIQQLNHIFMNIILNAAQSMAGKGKLTVKSYRLPDRDWVCIEISDTGPGIPDHILQHIFDPFFTTKEEGEGTGLGLSLAYSIVEKHGGHIKAKNNPDKGAVFIIELPLRGKNKGGDNRG